MKKQSAQAGFSHIVIVSGIVLLAVVGFAIYRIMNNEDATKNQQSVNASNEDKKAGVYMAN